MQVETIAQFAEACKSLDNQGIYELFEDEISQELRDKIYLTFEDLETPEPMRAAIIQIGELYGVQSLLDY